MIALKVDTGNEFGIWIQISYPTNYNVASLINKPWHHPGGFVMSLLTQVEPGAMSTLLFCYHCQYFCLLGFVSLDI